MGTLCMVSGVGSGSLRVERHEGVSGQGSFLVVPSPQPPPPDLSLCKQQSGSQAEPSVLFL
eukprot:scaffold152350_cov22-Tisochrysis_lutea.AAC.1